MFMCQVSDPSLSIAHSPLTIFFRMQSFGDMHFVFRDDTQRKRHVVLSERPLLPTRYPDPNCLEALGLEASVRYICHQLQWEEYSYAMNVTYKHITLEFISSLTYEPYIGRGFKRGHINFRLFGNEYTFNHKDFANLLGFQWP